MRYRLLGALEVDRAGQPVDLGTPRQRAVLAVLLTRANSTVSVAHLRDAVWDVAPAAADSNLRTYVTRLRRLLHDPDERESRLVTKRRGYLLRVLPGELDLAEFQELVDRGRAAAAEGDFAAATDSFSEALRLWRGRPFEDLQPGPGLRFEQTQLCELRLAVAEQHARASMELGADEEVIGDLERLTAEHPVREELVSLLMLALYRCGRQADALAVYAETRRLLVTEHGVEPGAGLRTMQQRVLAADPALGRAGENTADTVVSAHRQLPADLADFTGREADLARLHQHVGDGRSVAIVVVEGMAGVGKTRLAVHAAHELVRRGRFTELQLWADLRGFDPDSPPADPAGVLEGFLRLLGVAPRQVPADVDERAALYRDRLAGRQALVLLDNAASEAQVRPLLPGGPGCLVLVTSRRSLPDLDGACSVHLDVPGSAEAVTLLGRIAGEQRVAAEPGEAARVVDLCGRLPIAVTVAARRLGGRHRWTVKDLADRLATQTRRLDELRGRQRAVRAAFDLSFRTLPAQRRQVFLLVGMHPADDFAADSVAALADVPPDDAEDVLSALLDENLLEEIVPGRYRLHDLLRLYARERALSDIDEHTREVALRRLFSWYLHVAETAAAWLDPGHRPVPLDNPPPHLRLFSTRSDALDWCTAERANLVNIVRAAAEGGAHEIAWRLPCTLLTFFYLRKHWDDWISTHRIALRATLLLGDRAAQARVLSGLGVAASDVGRLDEAVNCHLAAQEPFRETGDIRGEAWNLNNLGVAYHDLRRFDDAARCHRNALPRFRAVGDSRGESISLSNLGDAYRRLGRFTKAGDCLRDALEIQNRTGDRAARRYTLLASGDLYRDQGVSARAIADYRDALTISRDLDDRRTVAVLLARLGDALEATGGRVSARKCWQQAHTIFFELGDPAAKVVRTRLDVREQPTEVS